MKKIIKLCLFAILLLVLSSKNVDAEEYNGVFSKSETINNIYYYKHRYDTETIKYPTHNFHEQAHIYRDSINHNYVYCIESWKQISGSRVGDYQVYNYNHPSTNISYELLNKLRLIAYYGYGYQDAFNDHTSAEWYAYTQMLIWRYQNPESDSYFVPSETSTQRLYEHETFVNNIESLVDNHRILPSISANLEVHVTDRAIFNDDNNVLKYYEVVNDNREISVNIEGNRLVVDADNYVGNFNIKLVRKYERFNKNMRVYTSGNYQNVLEPGNLAPTEINLTINVKPFIFSTKVENNVPVSTYYDTKSNYQEVLNTFDGLKMQIIPTKDIVDKKGNIIIPKGTVYKEFITTKDYSKIELLEGEYKVVQITEVEGYNSEETLIVIKSDLSKIIAMNRKYLGIQLAKTNEIFDENGQYQYINIPGIEFGLYADEDIYNIFGEIYAKKDTMINKFTTNEEPILKEIFKEGLPGRYYFKELTQLDGYEVNDTKYSYILKYNEETNNVGEILYITNYLKKSNINIQKLDLDTKKCLAQVEYGVYNEQNNLIYQNVTDSLGTLTIHLPLGKYFIKETKPLNGYINDEKTYYIDLGEDNKQLVLYNQKSIDEEIKKIKEEPQKEVPIDENLDNPKNNEDIIPKPLEEKVHEDELKNNDSKTEKQDNDISEMIVDVPKTEKNDYSIYLLILLSSLVLITYWKTKNE